MQVLNKWKILIEKQIKFNLRQKQLGIYYKEGSTAKKINMGQSCSLVSAEMIGKKNQLTNEDFTIDLDIQQEGETNSKGDLKNLQHKIPKVSELKIKTLTQKNQLSYIQKNQNKKHKRMGKMQGLQFFKQFDTLKDLIQGLECTQNTQNSLESGQYQKQNIKAIFHESMIQKASQLLSSNLGKFIMNQEKKVFKNVQVNIADFIKISEQPITQYYQFHQKIGQGSFGNVYRALCKHSGQQRAIKVLKKKQMSKENKKQFIAQMELLSKLDHPNIIKVYQLYYYNSFYYVVTEYCKGGTILKYINQHSNFGQNFISKIFKQLLSALQYLHQNLIVHLDIKLQNVVFLEKFQNQDDKLYIKLIDFGCSKNFIPYKKTKGKISGTLSYIAPQCLQGYYSQKCDIWSAGVLLHILLSGISPFKGKDSKETMKNIQTKEINFEAKSWSKVSSEGKELISAMLDRNSTRRISAKSALQHKWFQIMKNTQSAVINHDALKNLQKYYRGNNLVTIIETFLSLRKINQQERQRLADIFVSLDSDNSGSIEVSELFQVYKTQFGHHDISEVQNIINKIDANKSSAINFNEFLVAMTDRKKMFEQEHLKEAFNYFDSDKTGFIQKKQLKELLKGCQKQQFQYILQELDRDGDQKISRQEFVNYLARF